MFSRPKTLLFAFLTFCSTIESKPYLPLKFQFLYKLSIHNNLSTGAENVIGAYVIIMLVYRRLLTIHLHGKSNYVIPDISRKTAKLFVQDYNLEIHDVIK